MTKAEVEASLSTLDVLLLIGGILVAIGVTAESIFGFIHWRRSNQLRDIQSIENLAQQTEIAQLNNNIESLRVTAATAEQRVAEANLELERMKSPRTLQDVQERIKDLKSFGGTEYDFGSVFQDTEAVNLLRSIENMLRLSGWNRKASPGQFPALAIFGETDAVNVGVSSGLEVVAEDSAPQKVLDAATALGSALSFSLAPKNRFGDVIVRRSPGIAPNVIHIIVGSKRL